MTISKCRPFSCRPRAPYHNESVCYKQNFSGLFDIGQLDVEFMEAEMEVWRPSSQYMEEEEVMVVEEDEEWDITDEDGMEQYNEMRRSEIRQQFLSHLTSTTTKLLNYGMTTLS